MERKVKVHDLYLEMKSKRKLKMKAQSFDTALYSLGIHHGNQNKEEKKKMPSKREKTASI